MKRLFDWSLALMDKPRLYEIAAVAFLLMMAAAIAIRLLAMASIVGLFLPSEAEWTEGTFERLRVYLYYIPDTLENAALYMIAIPVCLLYARYLRGRL